MVERRVQRVAGRAQEWIIEHRWKRVAGKGKTQYRIVNLKSY